MHWLIEQFTSYLGNESQTPGAAGNIIWATIYVLLVFVGLSVAVIAMNWLERKILAHMQVRLGPMRVGPHGLLQPIADALKLLLKEDITPTLVDRVFYVLAPMIAEPMTLVFNPFELAAIGLSVITGALVVNDGESNWLEGLQLLGLYAILAVAFYVIPQ